jgi:DNA-binding transcriptional ArsR family regulator
MSSQSFDDVSADTPDFETIAKALGKPRRALLLALVETDRSHLNTAQLRERTDVARGSILHHLERLDSWGLVAELDTREYHGQSGISARTWQLTDEGRRFSATDEYMDVPDSAFVSPDTVAAHEQRISAIEDDIDVMGQLIVKVAMETGTMSPEKGQQLLEQRGWEE